MKIIQQRIEKLNRLYIAAKESNNISHLYRVNNLKRELYSRMAQITNIEIPHHA